MGIRNLPAEILVLILTDLDIEDQFSMSLSCRLLLQRIACSEFLCRACLETAHRFTPEYERASRTGRYATAWRRLVKKRIAIKTASPFQACILGFGEEVMFSNGALLYEPRFGDIRILFLDGTIFEELHVNTSRMMMEVKRRFCCRSADDSFTRPFHYANGIVTFLCEEEAEDGGRDYCILVADIKAGTLLDKRGLNTGRYFFVRNTEDFLWLGERTMALTDTPQWRLRMFDLSAQGWSSPKNLPSSFAGKSLGRDVCFEILGSFVYGAHSRVDDVTGHTTHHVFRLPVDGSSSFEYAYFSIDYKSGHYDNRYNELKIVKEESTGQIWVYEIRKEFLSRGYSERICHSHCVEFEEVPPSRKTTLDTFVEPLELLGARESHMIHRGESGLGIQESDPRRLLAYAYDTSTRTFLDIVKDSPPDEQKATIAHLRSRPYIDSKPWLWLSDQPPVQRLAPTRIWPPREPGGSQDPSSQTFMNPTNMAIHKAWWCFWNGLLIFSPASREGDGPRPIILLSFDPGLQIPGLGRADNHRSSLNVERLSELPERIGVAKSGWLTKVKPYHLLIRALEREHRRCYGLDLGYDRLNMNSI